MGEVCGLEGETMLKNKFHLIKFHECYITYDMDFRFVPSDPVCFDKLSGCD